MKNPESLRGRLTLLLLAGTGAVLILAALVLRLLTSAWLQRELDDSLLTKARALVTLTKQDRTEVELDFADEFMPEFERREEPEFFELWLGDGTLLERSNSLGEIDLPRLVEPSDQPRFRDLALPDGRRGRLVQVDFVPQVKDDEDVDVDVPLDPRTLEPASGYRTASVAIARSRETLDSRLAVLDLVLTVFAVSLLLAIALSVKIALRLGLRPLALMARQVRDLDAESLDTRIELSAPPTELRPIVEQLNALLDRLQTAFARERRLSSNLAHELRTPVAELRNLAEVGGRWPEDTASIRRYFDDAREIALQMERIVVHLLALARFEGGTEAIAASRFDLAELVTECWRPLATTARGKNVELRREVADDLAVETDRGKLELMVGNLLSNAVTYGPADQPISCSASGDDGRVTLTVANRCEDLVDADLTLLFDRFWRKDAARTGGRHAGLGLTLVRAFAELLGVEVTAELTADRIFRISLALPPARPSA